VRVASVVCGHKVEVPVRLVTSRAFGLVATIGGLVPPRCIARLRLEPVPPATIDDVCALLEQPCAECAT
jgi:hypothetical protein